MRIKNFIFTIIRIVLVIALIFAIFFFVFRKPAPSKKPFSQVKDIVVAAIQSENMEENTNRFFKKYYNLNADDYDGLLIYTPVTSMDAEEILLVKLKDPSQEAALIKAIEQRIETKMAAFKGYAPEEYDLCKKYIIDSSGGYVFFVISPEATKLDEVFRNAL